MHIVAVIVQAVAVRGLDEEQIAHRRRLRIEKHRLPISTDIAREDDTLTSQL
jgi:hypothetical protein